MLIAAEAFATAMLACWATNLDNMLLVLAGAPSGRARGHVLVFLVVLASVIALSLLISRGVDLAVPSAVMWLGLIPLSMGIYELRPRRRGPDGAGSALPATALAMTLLANSLDTLLVQTALFSDVASGYDGAALAGALAAAVLLALAIFMLLSRPGTSRRILALAPQARPWILIAVGLLILMDTGFAAQ
jgi:cadmium resistance protein CadD (predicted permease)